MKLSDRLNKLADDDLESRFRLVTIKQAIKADIEALIPEGMSPLHIRNSSTLQQTNHQIKGYNQAISDIKKAIKEYCD